MTSRWLTLLWLSARNLTRELRRSALTAAAMAVGLALLVVSRTLSDGAHGDWIDSGVRLGSGHVLFEAEGYQDSGSLDDRMDGSQVATVLAAVGAEVRGSAGSTGMLAPLASVRLSAQGLASSTQGAVPVLVSGVDPGAEVDFSRLGQDPVQGRYLEEGDRLHAFVGEKLLARLGLRLGSRMVLTAQGVSGDIEGQLVRVVGTYQTGLDELDEGLVHVPLATAQSWLGAEEAATSIPVLLADEVLTEAFVEEAQAALAGTGIRVVGWRESMPELDAIIRMDDAGDWVFHGILFAIVALAILNAIFMSVLHRKRELGLLRALGLSGAETGMVVFLEGFLVTAASGLVGVALGFALTWLFFRDGLDFSAFMPGDYTFSGVVMDPIIMPVMQTKHVLQSLFFIAVIGLAASLYPAFLASRLDPSEAVKVE
ncbi:MAG: ABC transporter permease [Longimicrobiales bacterium]